MQLTISDVLELNKKRGYGYDEFKNFRPLTSKEFFDISCEIGCNQDNPEYRNLFEKLSRWISKNLKVQSALEIGSGPGYFLNCLNELGVDARGMDGNSFSQEYFKSKHPKYSDRYHLDPLFQESYSPVDVLLTIEVFEHIDDNGLVAVFKKIKEQIKPKFIVFSSTPHADPNEGWDLQWGHINMKPTTEWDKLFAQNGFVVSANRPPVTPWARLYINESVVHLPQYQRLMKKLPWWNKLIR